MLLLNPLRTRILWKIANKKQTISSTLNGHISKTRVNSESKLKFSKSLFRFLQNSLVFCQLYPRGCTAGALPLQPPVSLPAACRIQRVKDELGKDLNYLFFVHFFRNEWKLSKNCNFYFWTKAMLLRNPFTTRILWKITNKKQTRNSTLNIYISKTRANSESKLKLPGSSFKFLQNSLVFCTRYPHGYMAGGSAPTTPCATTSSSQRWKSWIWARKTFELALFCLFFVGNEQKLSKYCNFYFWAKVMLLLNPFSTGILWKIGNKKQTRKSTLNSYMSKTRANSEWKLKLWESWLKFLQNSLVFCTLYPCGYTVEVLPSTNLGAATSGSWNSKS